MYQATPQSLTACTFEFHRQEFNVPYAMKHGNKVPWVPNARNVCSRICFVQISSNYKIAYSKSILRVTALKHNAKTLLILVEIRKNIGR